jgi:hypothetical protein
MDEAGREAGADSSGQNRSSPKNLLLLTDDAALSQSFGVFRFCPV